MPALGSVAPEDAAGGYSDRGPAVRIEPRQLPGAVTAHREPGQVGALGIAVELRRLLVKRGHGHLQHCRVGPVSGDGALRHDDDERPALGVVAHLEGQADLRLPHALRSALAAPVQEQDDRPQLAVVAPAILRQVDLELVDYSADLDTAIQKAGLLRRLLGVMPACSRGAGVRGPWSKNASDGRTGRGNPQET